MAVKGYSVFQGYYKDDRKNQRSIYRRWLLYDRRHWSYRRRRFLTYTDRKKKCSKLLVEIYGAPQVLENLAKKGSRLSNKLW